MQILRAKKIPKAGASFFWGVSPEGGGGYEKKIRAKFFLPPSQLESSSSFSASSSSAEVRDEPEAHNSTPIIVRGDGL